VSTIDADRLPDGEEPPLAVRVRTGTGPVQVRVWPSTDPDAARLPLLLALHGWTDSGEVFAPLARALGRRWTVVAPDAPGHGGTPWPGGPEYVVKDHRATALGVLDALPRVAGRRGRVVVLGHSLGAVTATRVAAARPDVVVHLVLEEPARARPPRSRSAGELLETVDEVRSLDERGRLTLLRTRTPDWPEDEYGPWLRSKLDLDRSHLDVPVDWGKPLRALLAKVSCPVLLVHGDPERGGIVPGSAAERCAAACRGGCDVLALPAGHNPRREARDAFVTAVAETLRRYRD